MRGEDIERPIAVERLADGVRRRPLIERHEDHRIVRALERVLERSVLFRARRRAEIHIERDLARFQPNEAVDDVGVDLARPRPAAEAGYAFRVDVDQDQLAGRGAREQRHALIGEPIVEGPQPARQRTAQNKQDDKGDRDRPFCHRSHQRRAPAVPNPTRAYLPPMFNPPTLTETPPAPTDAPTPPMPAETPSSPALTETPPPPTLAETPPAPTLTDAPPS